MKQLDLDRVLAGLGAKPKEGSVEAINRALGREKELEVLRRVKLALGIARGSIDVSLIRPGKRSQEHWEKVAYELDVALLALKKLYGDALEPLL